jgi:hypothetical protein
MILGEDKTPTMETGRSPGDRFWSASCVWLPNQPLTGQTVIVRNAGKTCRTGPLTERRLWVVMLSYT